MSTVKASPAVKPLERMSHEELLSCAGDASRCGASEWDLARELARREDGAALLARYDQAGGPARRVLVFALYLTSPTPDTIKLMKRMSHDEDEDVAYYALNYRAKLCGGDALRDLTAAPYRPRADCRQWATTVTLVGQCRYTGGVPFLVQSLDHACLNVGLAALEGLRVFDPGAPSFNSPREAKGYFQKRFAR